MNEDHPQCNVPRRAIKACRDKGWGILLLRQWPVHPFSFMVVRAYLSIAATTQDPAGQDLHHSLWLFTLANIWKQPMCPSADEWIKQL